MCFVHHGLEVLLYTCSVSWQLYILHYQDLEPSGMVSRPQVPQFSSGDVVRILDDIATVHKLQEGHGGWVDDMALVSVCILSETEPQYNMYYTIAK